MASYSPTIINNTEPSVSVVSADSGSGAVAPVTYNEIKQSMGRFVYDVKSIYLYSDNIRQLSGVINYNRFDSDGNKKIYNITPVIDPYQQVSSLNLSLESGDLPVVFNGNSSISTTILPNTYVQVQFQTFRVKNTTTENDLMIEEEIVYEEKEPVKFAEAKPDKVIFENFNGKSENNYNDSYIMIILVIAAASVFAYFYNKKD